MLELRLELLVLKNSMVPHSKFQFGGSFSNYQ